MSVLRPLLFVLLLLNLLALASGQGWLGTATRPGEPERLTNQINPELIVLLAADAAVPAAAPSATIAPPSQSEPPAPQPLATAPSDSTAAGGGAAHADAGAASDGTAPPGADTVHPAPSEALPSCVAYARVSLQRAHEIERVAQGLGHELALARETIEAPGGWWVRLPPSESLQAAERRARELRGLGVRDLFIIREAGPNQFAISLGLFRSEAGARQHLADLQSRRVRGAEIAVRNPAVARVEVRGPAPLVRALAEQLAGELPDTASSDCFP